MSRIMDAALDPACLLCFSPLGWHSPLRQGVIWPREGGSGNSYAERLNLIRLTNILNTGTHFEATNPSLASRIDTAIDLRGKVSDYTVIVDFEAAALSSNQQKQELAGQGACVAPATVPAIMALAYGHDNNTSGNYFLQLTQEIGGARYPLNRTIDHLTGWHIACGKIQINYSTQKTGIYLYLDGVYLSGMVVSGIPAGSAYSTYANYAIGDNRNGSWANYWGKIHQGALFAKALSNNQIAYLSN